VRAEVLKLRYLPFPRWTGAALAAIVLVVGIVLVIVEPSEPEKYVSIPDSSVGLATLVAALVFGVWVATLEFGAGTLQRTLLAEPARGRVLASKLTVALLAAAIGGLAVAAAAGGFSHLAANHAGVAIDDSDLAGSLFGSVPVWITAAAVGFGFGLLARSVGGGIALSLVFVLAFDGVISFIPGAADYTYGQLSQDVTNNISGMGETQSGLAIGIAGTILWCVLIVVPGWLRFLRGDLK
jgi:ABC-2 type transport system permease protein